MHELAFSDAVRPTPVVILKIPLRTYSLGHELELYKLRNPLLLLSIEQFNALDYVQQRRAIIEAVLVCADSWAARCRLSEPSLFHWRSRWHALKVKLWARGLQPSDFPCAIAEMRNYLDEAHKLPPPPDKEIDEMLNGKPDAKGRAFGAPLLANLVLFARRSLPEADSWDAGYAATTWLYFPYHESEGAYKIENYREWDERVTLAATPLRSTTLNQNKNENHAAATPDRPAKTTASASSTQKVTGLATPPPNLNEPEVTHGL